MKNLSIEGRRAINSLNSTESGVYYAANRCADRDALSYHSP